MGDLCARLLAKQVVVLRSEILQKVQISLTLLQPRATAAAAAAANSRHIRSAQSLHTMR